MINFIVLSFLQILILPGLIFSILKKRVDLLLIFSLSIFLNYLFITIINLTSFDKNIFFYIIIISEIIILSYLFLVKTIFQDHTNLKINMNLLDVIFIIIFFYLILKLFTYYNPFYGTLFQEGDVLLSWNEWAYNIINTSYSPGYLIPNSFDSDFTINQSRSYYGQLIPSNWAIFYLLTGYSDITNFPKFLNFIFSIFVIFFLIKNFLLTKKIFYFITFILLVFLFFKEHYYFIYSGLVDAPMASFIFLSLMHVIKLDNVNIKKLEIGIIFAIIAANIKLSALYYSLIFLPIYIYVNYFKEYKKKIFYYIFFLIFFSLWWPIYQYIFFDINIFLNNNLDYLESLSVKNINDGINRFSLLFSGNHLVLFVVSIFFLISIFVRKINIISIFLILPYIIIWYNFSSYDIRNILLIIPLICLVISYLLSKINFLNHSMKEIIFINQKIHKKIVKKIFFSLIIFFSFFILFFNQNLNDKLIKSILAQKVTIKNKAINQYIIDNIENIDHVFTDYIYLKYVLSSEQMNKVKICNLFQKQNLRHCNFNKINKNLLITYYDDSLFHLLSKDYEFNLIENFGDIKVYKFK